MFHLFVDLLLNTNNDILLKNPILHVAGKKRLTRDKQLEFVVVDVSEVLIERPKKSSEATIVEKRSTIA